MSECFVHKTRYGFNSQVWHKVTSDKGLVLGIVLRENSAPRYLVIFEDSRKDDECLEAELTDEPQITAK